ncbi:MAG: sirohydrochlorin nickelochelatase [Methanobrevibacter sp.]|nr:sirohydrochlorin nickelochelatase [Methanobrevibacter sp.]
MDTNSKLSNNTAVILVSHGSTLPYAEEVFEEIKEKFIKKTNLPAEIGYMKVSKPTIAGAVEILKDEVEDLDKIIALPVFLAPGIHTNIDIPQLLGLKPLEEDPRCPDGNYPPEHYLSIADDVDFDGEIELLSSIGPRDELLDIIDKRIDEALAQSKLGDVKTGVLLVTHGSRLNYNKEFATELYNKFEKTCKYPSSFGFMELCGPSIPESINKLVDENALERLVVVPVFIAPGMHTTHDIPHILGFLEAHEHEHSHSHGHGDHDHVHDLTPVDFNGEILYPEPIKADDILIDILAKMVEEKL